ncbi:MAG TPA: ABC transporter permease [Rhodanobacteraceae bacterium]
MFGYYLHLAWQRCRHHWASSCLVALTLAIGIAACMTTLTLVDTFAGAPIPGVSNHLYVTTLTPTTDTAPDSQLAWPLALAILHARRADTQAALAQTRPRVSDADGRHGTVTSGLLASGRILATLGIALRFGRAWTQRELDAHAPVALIDTHLAERLFGADDVVGRSITLNKRRFRVIGVTVPWQPRMRFSDVEQAVPGPLGRPVRIILPIGAALAAGVGPLSAGACGNGGPADTAFGTVKLHGCAWLELWTRLDTPAARAGYVRFLRHFAQARQHHGYFAKPMHAALYGTRAWMDLNAMTPDGVALNALLAGAFLLLCMSQVVGLVTARFLDGRAHAAIRRALGATRGQILAQHLVESTLLGAGGGLVALPLTLLGLWIVRAQPVGYAAAAQCHWDMFVLLLIVALAAGALVGAWPAWRVGRQPPARCIKQG